MRGADWLGILANGEFRVPASSHDSAGPSACFPERFPHAQLLRCPACPACSGPALQHQPEGCGGVWDRPRQRIWLLGLGGRPLQRVIRSRHAAPLPPVRLPGELRQQASRLARLAAARVARVARVARQQQEGEALLSFISTVYSCCCILFPTGVALLCACRCR